MTVYSHFQEKALIYIFDLARVFPVRDPRDKINNENKPNSDRDPRLIPVLEIVNIEASYSK